MPESFNSRRSGSMPTRTTTRTGVVTDVRSGSIAGRDSAKTSVQEQLPFDAVRYKIVSEDGRLVLVELKHK